MLDLHLYLYSQFQSMSKDESRKGKGGPRLKYRDPDGNKPTEPPGGYQENSIDSPAALFLADLYLSGNPEYDPDNPNKCYDDWSNNHRHLRYLRPKKFPDLHRSIIKNVLIRLAKKKQGADSDIDSSFNGSDYSAPPSPTSPTIVRKKVQFRSPLQASLPAPRGQPNSAALMSQKPDPKPSSMSKKPKPSTMSQKYEPLLDLSTIQQHHDDSPVLFQTSVAPLRNGRNLLHMCVLPSGADTKTAIAFRDKHHPDRYINQCDMTAMEDEQWVDDAFVNGKWDAHTIGEDRGLTSPVSSMRMMILSPVSKECSMSSPMTAQALHVRRGLCTRPPIFQ